MSREDVPPASPDVAGSGLCDASTATNSFQVTLKITGACTLTANPLDFGTNNGAITANIDAQSTLVANCTSGAPYSIGLDNGTGSGATASSRVMTNTSSSSATVNYSLYAASARTTVWDNNCTTLPGTGANCANGTGTGANQTINVYGRVPSGQTPAVGSYADTVTATLNF